VSNGEEGSVREIILVCAVLTVLFADPHGAWAYGDNAHPHAAPGTRAKLVPIAPGTRVEDRAPETWSHLVIKSRPRLASGDLQTLPRSAFRTAGLFRTVILADIGPGDDEASTLVLRRIGVGLSVPVAAGGDVVVESGRLAELGIRLGFMEKAVLQAAEAELARGRLVASTPTFALYRGPAMVQVGQSHQSVDLYYAFLVDPRRGSLRVLLWPQSVARAGATTLATPVELSPNLLFDCDLNVKAKRLLGTVPTSWSFAMESLPPGKTRPISPALAIYLAEDIQRRDPIRMEQAIRNALTVRRPPVEQPASGS
jgi:hypothetical protein